MSPFAQLRCKLNPPTVSPELVLPILVAAIVAAMILPLPAWILDAGLALNLAAAASLLVAALTVKEPLEVTAFPTLLLVTTLLRLALNVSSTRLALAEGHAGQVIQAFGEFVVRGNYLVGAVVFAILALVQFLVVAKGAERVAEVSARFSLDAMPGKQMSIDADLRAGAIDQAQARARRRALERESQMFGAMDGAMKFVKGDVIAGLVIVVVNLVGGILVGVFQNGMDLSDAASTYALIAIGDGLVSQIPSLCIAVAAGVVVTRVGSERAEDSLGADIGRQFFGQAKALYIVSGLCAALGLMPGMPRLTFLALAAGLAWAGRTLARAKQRRAESRPEAEASTSEATGASAPAESDVGVMPLTLDLGQDFAAWATEPDGRFIKVELAQARERVFRELGVRVPGIRVRTGAPYMAPNGYAVLVDDVPAGSGMVAVGSVYASCRPEEISYLGVSAEACADPSGGDSLARVDEGSRPKLELAQVRVRSARELVLDHLTLVLKKHAAQLLGVQEVQALLDAFEPCAPALVRSALEKVPLPLLTEVLRKLVQEEVSIRNLRAILEALVAPTTEGDAVQLAERCRQALHRYLSFKFAPHGMLYAYLVDPVVEEVLREQLAQGAADPERVSAILEGMRRIAHGGPVVVLAAPDIRRPLRKLCEGAFPQVAVLTYAELNPDQQIRPVGRLALAA